MNLTLHISRDQKSTIFPYTTLFRSKEKEEKECLIKMQQGDEVARNTLIEHNLRLVAHIVKKFETNADDTDDLNFFTMRSEEHTSELQSRFDLVCRLLLEKKNQANSK